MFPYFVEHQAEHLLPTHTKLFQKGSKCLKCCIHSDSTLSLKAYTEPTASYLQGQPVYPGHQQGVVVQQGGTVTTIVTSQTVQQVTAKLFTANEMCLG